MKHYLTENKLTEENNDLTCVEVSHNLDCIINPTLDHRDVMSGRLFAVKDGSETRVSLIAQNSYKKLIAQAPKPEAGTYRLRLRTQSTGDSHLPKNPKGTHLGRFAYGDLIHRCMAIAYTGV